ncbi:MAG: hypothetical protein HZA93_18390 [Verrucomicrobia bacterium]|nr:hypothetical protein [Verrucomicrobiota bacterium]
MNAATPGHPAHSPIPGWLLLLTGFALVTAAWLLPANLKSVNPPLLRKAGAGTPSLGAYGRDLVDLEKIGPASLVLAAAKATDDPRSPALASAIETATTRQPGIAAWGGWDPFIDPLFNLRVDTSKRASTPVLTFFIPEKSREVLRGYLANSRSPGVQALLNLRGLTATGRFMPATKPGGQPLDALILLSALLYQGERSAPPLQRELRALAETAVARKELADLEPFFLDLLSLGRRLDWMQLSELLRRTANAKTVGEFAHLARVAPDQLALLYAAALFSDSADQAAGYLIQFGKAGVEDLRLALAHGQGAVKLLLSRQVPVTRTTSPALDAAAEFALLHSQLALVLKYLGFVLGAWLIVRGLETVLPRASELNLPMSALPRMRAGALAVMFAGLLVVATEPFLLKAAPPSEYRVRLRIPVLVATAEAPPAQPSQPTTTMDSSTLLSVGLFASLQVVMYFICLVKIRDVARQNVPPLVKLKLMENEENLFDGGLYVGIAGTATALVLQVLGVIQANLLAAYASNLFGIICVALVKIRHVRAYKRELILEAQAEAKV